MRTETTRAGARGARSAAPTRQVWLPLSRLSLDNKPWIFGLVCLLTLLFAYFSQQTTFDTNLQHINYMTDMQRADQEAFQRLLGQEGKVPVYVATEGHSWEEALQRREAIQPQLARIIQTCKEKQVRTIFVQQEFDRKNAELIAKETGTRIATINPLSYDWTGELLKIAHTLHDQ